MLSDHLHYRSASSETVKSTSPPVLIYMIPGNPGLIEYYREFLRDLSRNLQQHPGGAQYHVFGHSLAGFEVNAENRAQHDPILGHQPPFSLQEQVTYVQRQVREAVESTTSPKGRGRTPVILMGHSVGAYILLEVIARQQAAQRKNGPDPTNSTYEIIGGICLFPTVVHIAKSPTGRKVAPIAKLPRLAIAVQALATLLCLLLPDSILFQLVKWVTGMPEESARVTKAFIQSPNGVRQSLHMGKQELDQITDDKWNDEIWTSQSSSSTGKEDGLLDRPQLYFFWGEHDHWVDNATRDQLIAKQAQSDARRDDGKPHMEIDSRGLPHAFCIRHSQAVAEKVSSYIHEIMASLGQ